MTERTVIMTVVYAIIGVCFLAGWLSERRTKR